MRPAALLVWIGVGTGTVAGGPAKEPRPPIVGTVVDADRRPAAGAGVFFAPRWPGGN